LGVAGTNNQLKVWPLLQQTLSHRKTRFDHSIQFEREVLVGLLVFVIDSLDAGGFWVIADEIGY